MLQKSTLWLRWVAAHFWELKLVLRSLPNPERGHSSDGNSSEGTILKVTACNVTKCIFLLIICFPKST